MVIKWLKLAGKFDAKILEHRYKNTILGPFKI